MIWELIELLAHPDDLAFRIVNGDIVVAPIHDLREAGERIIDLSERNR